MQSPDTAFRLTQPDPHPGISLCCHRVRGFALIILRLRIPQFPVQAILPDQCLVRAYLHDLSAVEHGDLVAEPAACLEKYLLDLLYRGKAVD